MTRLVKVGRLVKIVRRFLPQGNKSNKNIKIADQMGHALIQTFSIAIVVLYSGYLVSCLFFFVTKFMDFPTDSWVRLNNLIDSPPFDQFLVSFYWTIQTLFSVGYGDVKVVNYADRAFAIVWMLSGIGFYSYTIGNMT